MSRNKTALDRAALLQRVGSLGQLGGTRHYTLNDGRCKGVSAIDFDTGAGFRFTALPDRGLDLSLASYRGTNLVYLAPAGEVSAAFFEPGGLGWLRTFFAGLLTTCGPSNIGAPCVDGDAALGLHGRFNVTPATRVRDTSGWHGDDYVLEVTGEVEDSVLFGDKIRVTRTISTRLGARSLRIEDKVENVGYRTSPFAILYHINAGYPLLDAGAELMVGASSCQPLNDHAAAAEKDRLRFTEPADGFQEMNYLYTMEAAADGFAHAAFINHSLDGGLGLHIKSDPRELPYLNEWKMLGLGEYVVGVEPCNSPCAPRSTVREQGLLPFLEPGEARTIHVEIGVLDGPEEIEKFESLLA